MPTLAGRAVLHAAALCSVPPCARCCAPPRLPACRCAPTTVRCAPICRAPHVVACIDSRALPGPPPNPCRAALCRAVLRTAVRTLLRTTTAFTAATSTAALCAPTHCMSLLASGRELCPVHHPPHAAAALCTCRCAALMPRRRAHAAAPPPCPLPPCRAARTRARPSALGRGRAPASADQCGACCVRSKSRLLEDTDRCARPCSARLTPASAAMPAPVPVAPRHAPRAAAAQ